MSEVADRAAGEFLTAYPDERQRAQAERWLGLLASQAADGGPVRWWKIPALAPAQAVLAVRRFLLFVATAAVVGWGIYVGAGVPEGGFLTPLAWYGVVCLVGCRFVVGPILVRRRYRPVTELRLVPPRAIRPRWPRGRAEYRALLIGTLLFGLGILPVLVRQWSVQATGRPRATPASTYRSERIACLITGLAWAPAGVALVVIPFRGTWLFPEIVVAHAAVAALWGALLSGPYPLLKLSELVMSADWADRVRFLPLLEDAADRGVLRRARGGYEFRDDAVRASLAMSGRATLAGHAELQARRLARKGVRTTIAKHLATKHGRGRATAIFTAGAIVAAAISFGIWDAGAGGSVNGHIDWVLFPGSALIGVLSGVLAGGVVFWLIVLVSSLSQLTVTCLPPRSRRARLGWAVVAVAVVAALIAAEGTVLAGIVAFVLPAALVAACGTWACVLAYHRTRAARRRWLRAASDVIAAATIGATLLLLLEHRLLTALPAAGLLFPAAGWGSFRLWRKMSGSERLAVKAGADLVFALLLGGQVVLLLVWLANLLGMPPAELALVRVVLGRAGALADLPWWVWTGVWLLLAAASLAFVRWPGRLKIAAERFERWRVATATEITGRVLTGVHIGLLAVVFAGVAAPAALTPALSRKLRAAYEVAFQRELLDEGEIAAYTAISGQLAGQPTSPVLTRLVMKIHEISPPDDAQAAPGPEAENARRLGEAEALALGLAAPPSLDSATATASAAAEAGLAEPVPQPSGLADRAATVQHQETQQDVAAKRVEAAADLTAKVVASLVSIPRLSDNEVVQVVREYLAGLVEDSPLKNTFAAWIERLPGAKPPPDATTEVIPVPDRLEQAATEQLSAEFSSPTLDPVTDPLLTDPALNKAQAEDPLDGAVDLINQARYAQDPSGPCAGCTVPGGSNDNLDLPGEGPQEDHPEEP